MITIKTTIDELLHDELISVRTYNACAYNEPKLFTVGDIVNFYNENRSFLSIRKCGRKSAEELMNILSSLSGPIEEVEQFEDARDDIKQVFIDEYELFILNPQKTHSLIDAFQIVFPSSKVFYEICINKSAEDIFVLKNYNLISDGSLAYKVRCAAVEIISEISRRLLNQLKEDDSYRASISKLCIEAKEILYNDYKADYCKYEMSSAKRKLLLREFNELIEKASARAQSLSRTFISDMYSLVPLLNLSEAEFVNKFGYKKKSSNYFYNQILLPFKDTYNAITQDDIDDSYLDIALKFPFLNKTSLEFVMQFKYTEGYIPMFFVTNELLRDLQYKHKNYKLYCQKFALGNYTDKSTLIEIADDNSLTRERVRQIVASIRLQDERIFTYKEWDYYTDLHEFFITDKSEYFIRLLNKENLSISFEGFAKICTIALKYIYNYDYGFECLVSRKYEKEIMNLLSNTTAHKNDNLSSDKLISLSELCNTKKIDADLYNIIKSEIAPRLDVELVDNSFVFAQTYIDYSREVYEYLYSIGEPVHIENILKYLNNKYPCHPITIENLKVKLRGTNILPVGKTSNYKLSHWRNVFGGSIRDLIRDIMQSRSTPIHIDELTNLVTDSFEKTNKKNILSSLYSCDDFIVFAGGYYGLVNKEYPSEYIEIDLKKRLSFEDRFESYKQFVSDCGRLPYLSGIEEEESLKRWQVNVCKKNLDVTDEQVRLLTEFMESKSNLPSSSLEDRFYKNCKEFLDYVKTNFELPTYTTSNSLCKWFNKNIPLYSEYEDNRKLYFINLLEELKGYGFIF